MTIPRATCRSCGREGLELVLPLGKTPLANALLTHDQLDAEEPTYPLDLALCKSCSLVQITETVPAEKLFRDYIYFSSFSDTILQHARQLVERLIDSRRLGKGDLAVELASNDGYLLQYYRQRGIPVLGIEPARNVARIAQEQRGIRTLCDFFGEALARRLASDGLRADVLHAHNVLAHVPDLNGFVEGIRLLLRTDGRRAGKDQEPGGAESPVRDGPACGIGVIEVPYVKDMVDNGEFDTIYHEHLCYFSLTALDRLFGRHGLVVTNVERLPIHGGSLRVFVAPVPGGAAPGAMPPRSLAVRSLLEEESGWGVDKPAFYLGFADRVEGIRLRLVELLEDLKRQGKRIAAYGAAAKGSTLLNTLGIGPDILDFVVDRSTYKQGRFMPGVKLPIRPPGHLIDERPDYVLLLAWNFADEILAQQEEYRRLGGRFILPLPEPRILEQG
jgi:SAM-dependent methyltransferase